MGENIYDTIKGLSFQTYTPQEIEKLSAVEVTNLVVLDNVGHPTPGGLYDLRFGPNEKDELCATCELNYFHCPGHVGHIKLPVCVFNPVFLPKLYQILKGSCYHCHKLFAPPLAVQLTLYQLRALDHGLLSLVQDLAEVASGGSEVIDATIVFKKLKEMFERALKEAKLGSTNQHVKSVVEFRRNIVKDFIRNYMMKSISKCPHCKTPRKKMTLYKTRIVCTEGRVKLESEKDRGNKEITPEKARDHMYILWKNQKDILQCLYRILAQEEKQQNVAVDIFFLSSVIVPPSRFRPLIVMKGKKYADQQTLKFKDILSDCKLIQNIWRLAKRVDIDENEKALINKIPGKSEGDKFNYVYQSLQRHVAELFDCEQSKENFSKGIKQILEKKEGLFRMNMMGKRVNYAARSVISPDPYIQVNEIGIPLVFAKKLTFPEPASQWNFEKLRQAVKNGPNIYPGASLIQKEDGKIVKLTGEPSQREALSKLLLTQQGSVIGGVKIVHRHIQDGDMLLLNRQPTLHKPSIMAHKARILPGEKTLRLHYANCKAYNADFDGDEMNAHLPQTYGGQAECRHIVNVNHQYLVPKDGTPLSGLIQDHIIAGTLLTMRGRFFDRNDYEKLIYSALTFTRKRLKLLSPCIWKPEALWSGKQIVSSIIINLIPEDKLPPTLEGKAKVSSKNWVREPVRDWKAGGTPLSGDNMSESEVIIRSGELLCGVIDKAQIGPTPYSLIHVCYELYGGEISSVILTALARLFTHYLQFYSGFTLGIKDIVLTPKADKKRKKVLKKTKAKGLIACANALEVENPEENIEKLLTKYKETHFNRDDFGLKVVDMEMKKVTHELNNKINTICIPEGLKIKFPFNNLQLMVESGAKGSSVNAMQISCLLGQIELEGRRMPLMLNGCTLPSFPAYDTSPEAGGFVTGRFLSSINPQEYFFHCMAGREGLIDTAVKTSRSGYLQRCLIKHLEGVTVNYDLTVRDSDGSIVQFLYGEDGMDVGKMQLLKENQFHLLAKNYDAVINKEQLEMLLDRKDSDMEKQKKKIKKWKKKHNSSEPRLSLINKTEIPPAFSDLKKRLQKILNEKQNIDEYVKKKFERKHGRCPDPVSSKFKPDVTFGSVTEKLDSAISDYVARNPHGLLHYDTEDISGKLSAEKFQDLCYYRAMKSLAEPGEAVGLLAAQSIGEPSTQMTLNTFHFAGKGEMNVTLGIPRIREILMTASANIATPTMDLPLLDKLGIEEEAEKLRLQLAPVSLKEILEAIKVKEYISVSTNVSSTRSYIVKFKFLKYSEYKGYINTSPSKILHYMEHVFIKKILEVLKKKMKQSSSLDFVGFMKDNIKKVEPNEDESEDVPQADDPTQLNEVESSEESEDEGDTISAKSKLHHKQEQEYEDPEDEEMLPESNSETSDIETEISIKKEVRSSDEGENAAANPHEFKKTPKMTVSENDKALRVNYVKCIHHWIADYNFDSRYERWCEVTFQVGLDGCKIDMQSLLEEEVNKAYVHLVPEIKDAILVKNPNAKDGSKLMLKTNGVNFLEIFKYVDIIDINKIYSNNIQAIAETYGIEAAARAIQKEIENVFAAYGIKVDPRHLSLISDYMTSSGAYRPCNRIGMEANASPLQQMTFETTRNFLVDAMLLGIDDQLKSPSANIIAGKQVRAGTCAFDLCPKFGR